MPTGLVETVALLRRRPWPQPVTVEYQITPGGDPIRRQTGGGSLSDRPLGRCRPLAGQAACRQTIQPSRTTDGSNYEDPVTTQSRALARLSREIAEVVLTQQKNSEE